MTHEIGLGMAVGIVFLAMVVILINTFMFSLYFDSWNGQPKKKVDLYEVLKPSTWVDNHRFKRVSLASFIEVSRCHESETLNCFFENQTISHSLPRRTIIRP